MQTIKDAIHQDIELIDFEIDILDTPPVQRLRNIHQMGFAYLVYPSATHTRFEHSLGVMYLAGAISSNLLFDETTTAELRLAGLLHDIGHFPFSHNQKIETYIEHNLKIDHEQVSCSFIKNNYSDALKSAGLSPKRIIDIINGHGKYGSIMSSGIDIDKMDYLVRDAYFTGTAYGLIDVSRLLSTVAFKKELAFKKKGLRNVEAVIISRFMMYSTVYFHKTIEIADAMFSKAVIDAFNSCIIDPNDYIRMDDIDLVYTLRKNKSELMNRLTSRRLYKLGSLITGSDNNQAIFNKSVNLKSEDLETIERDMETKLGLPKDSLLINIITKKSLEPIKILENSTLIPLEDLSSFSKSVTKEEWKNWHIQFIAPEKHRNKIKDANTLFQTYL